MTDHTQRADFTRESAKSQRGSLAEVRKQDVHYDLLTIREAMRRFDLYERLIYRWVAEGRLHPVKPNGRTLYPAWELEDLTAERRSAKCSLPLAAA